MHALVRLVVVGSLAAGLGCTGQNAGFPMSAATDAGPDVGTSSADADAADAQDAGPPAPARHRIACGYDFTCAIHGDGRVKCWGQNNRGQLGIGSQDVHGLYGKGMGNDLPFVDLGPGEKAVSLSLGREHACALLESGKVKCWGGNGSGQLGLGSHFQPGAHPQDMGSQLAAVDLGSGRTAITISAGDESTCAVLDDHTVKCWGNNDGGQLGLGPVLSAGGDAGQMGDALPVVDLGPQAKVVDLSAGFRDTCAVLVGGALKCWGANDIGQLGTGDPTQHGTTLESMGAALPSPDLGTPFAVASASAGGNVECAVDTTGMLKCFGQNNYGQLGLGDTKTRGLLPGDMAAALAPVDLGAGTQVAAAAAGGTFTCALLASGSVKCFGDNGNGQLAQGDTLSRGGQPQDMGDNLPAINFGVTVPAVELAAGMQHACARFAMDPFAVGARGRRWASTRQARPATSSATNPWILAPIGPP